ncbi:MAG: hydantoinase/oxoprolinase N-terminal domain-containing protein [Granulosicoccaceae bacterium]
MALKLGIDTGGTYTDAVLLNDQQQVIASAKSLTTQHQLSLGIGSAIDAVLAQSNETIELVSLSTTLATNALVEGEGAPVCLILAGFKPEQAERPELRAVMGSDPAVTVAGGHRADGEEQEPLDTEAVRELVQRVGPQVSAFAVTSLFAVRNPAHEHAIREIIRRHSNLPVSCGHELSAKLDAPKRALTAVVNARLIGLLSQLLEATRGIMSDRRIDAPLMVVKGDGSLISDRVATNCPVETILSGPAASLVGASHLCGAQNALVADMGGTTTDVAELIDGRPKIDPRGALVGGHRTMVEAVQMHTYALGGDSEVHYDRESHRYQVGPRRAVPLSLLVHEHPELISPLRQQAELDYPRTHDAQFALRRRSLPEEQILSPRQRYLWDMLADGPVALSVLFEDQTMDRTLDRLISLGLAIKSSFTPSDACHILGKQQGWNTEAAQLAAQILSLYSSQNLGLSGLTSESFAQHILDKVSRQAAARLMETALAETLEGSPGQMSAGQKALFELALQKPEGALLQASFSLATPLVGLGAPVQSYYSDTAALCNTRLEIPEFAHVANAVGAVVGTVRQRAHALITPIDRVAVRVHCGELQKDFPTLEAGAAWCEQQLRETALQLALEAGAEDPQVSFERHDNIASKNNEEVFFESKLVATASGRPAATRRH